MIQIQNKQDCCGCNACVQKCPVQCITMCEDEQGFLYPDVDQSKCIDCNLCEKVCPVIHQAKPRKPLCAYAAKNPNEEIRLKSSSGGIFTQLAEQTIDKGGVVFGAQFNENWEVIHACAETIEGLAAFRGSKYVQSGIGNTYKEAETFLKAGREVLFSGTPCQIAGLKRFLRKDYSNLFTVDLICHGVPSPMVWRDYLQYISNGDEPKEISFRDKSTGWSRYSTHYLFKNKNLIQKASKDIYIEGFLKDLYLRLSCYACPAKAGKSESDLTIADFWGISRFYPKYDDDKGVGLIFLNTVKAKQLYQALLIENIEVTYEQGIACNSSYYKSVKEPKLRNEFWELYATKGIDAIPVICKKMQPSYLKRGINLGKRIVKRIMKIKYK